MIPRGATQGRAAVEQAVASDRAAETLLATGAIDVPGLHRSDPVHSLGTVHASIVGAYDGRGPIRLGRSRRLAVIAADGLGFHHAVGSLNPDMIRPLTSEFPTTTMACMLTALTGRRACEHGFVGVQYLDADGLGSVNCHDGHRDEPTSEAAARPTVTPTFPTIFTDLADAGVATIALANDLARVHSGIRSRLFLDCETLWSPLPPSADPRSLVAAFGNQLTAALAGVGPAVVWAYLDLDTHIHRRGMDGALHDACRSIDRLARDLARDGTAVMLFSDHGLTANRASPETERTWLHASSPEWCRLPAGGAGRVRWLYPHAQRQAELLDWLAGGVGDSTVATPESLASMGLLAPESIGQRRLGEIVVLARGPDFPTPVPSVAYEHGSMTAEEMLVPMAVWHPDR